MVMIVVGQAFWRRPARKERLLGPPCASQPPHSHSCAAPWEPAEGTVRAETRDILCDKREEEEEAAQCKIAIVAEV